MDVTGHYVEGDIQMPYKRLNSKLFKEVFQWLNDNGYREIASTIGREYTKNKDFLEGRSNENTIELKPSSLYLNEYAIPSNAASSALENILSAGGTIGPELQLRLKNMGQGFYGKNRIKSQDKSYTITEIRNLFSQWKNLKPKKGC